jgi:hypothetical protein
LGLFLMRQLLRICLVVSALLAAVAAFAVPETSFYICAHEDDWQLFDGHEGYDDISSGKNVVIIYVTSGDGGLRMGGTGGVPYYRARELGTQASIQVPAALSGTVRNGDGWFTRTINYKKLYVNKERNVTSYYLRLPDGNPGGGGYATNFNQSIAKLYYNQISYITTIDNSATYSSWANLRFTVESIIRYHVGNQSGFRLATHNPDWDVNTNSHSDHIHAGILAREAGHDTGAVMRCWLDYVINTMPANLDRDQLIAKARMQGSIGTMLGFYDYDPTADAWHSSFLDRGYISPLP